MAAIENTEFSGSDRWVNDVSSLQARLLDKLLTIGFVRPGEDDAISHRLAELAYMCTAVSERILPGFLRADGAELSDLAVDLNEDLREMRESIEAMGDELLRLMNHLNP